jgi:hypothetical protein
MHTVLRSRSKIGRDQPFRRYRRVLWPAQRRTLATEAAARRAAARIGLPLEIREVGDAGLEAQLERLLDVSA